MKNKTNTPKIIAPRRGWQKEIAAELGCCTRTVIEAIHYNLTGRKRDKCRELFIQKYGIK